MHAEKAALNIGAIEEMAIRQPVSSSASGGRGLNSQGTDDHCARQA